MQKNKELLQKDKYSFVYAVGPIPMMEKVSIVTKDFNVKTSRLARGIPMGSELQYIDEITMKKSLENRVPI